VRIAIPLATAICQVHEHDLIHKDIAPANILSCSRSMLAIGKNSSCVAQCP
jgi:serine/threonine protein kinase